MSRADREEIRTGRDRRRRPTRPWDILFRKARRSRIRRESDLRPGQIPVVDLVPPALIGPSILLLILTILDGVLTWLLIESHCEEANPLMAAFVDRGLAEFLGAKYAITSVGLVLLILMQGYPMFGSRFRVGHLIPIFVGLYLLLIGYQLVLFQKASAPLLDVIEPARRSAERGP